MQIKLEVLARETIHYPAKGTRAAGSFEVINCRESSPASLLIPVRLASRDFPTLKGGEVVTVLVSDISRRDDSAFVNVRGTLVNGK